MADAELSAKIKVDSEVPQAMDKAKSATVSFSKQIEDIQKKFSTGFKDIFLGFTAPMVIIQSVISYLSTAMEKAKQDAKEGLDLISQGETKFATSDETRTAAFFKRRKQLLEERELIKAGRESLTQQILTDPALAKGLILHDRIMKRLQAGESAAGISRDEEMQRIAMDYLKQTEQGRKILAESTPQEVTLKEKADKEKAAADAKDLAELKQFAGRSKPGEVGGYGNVIGVGSNIAIEMAQMQIDELKRHTELLQMIATKESVSAVDFSKGDKSNTTPSRAKLLSGK